MLQILAKAIPPGAILLAAAAGLCLGALSLAGTRPATAEPVTLPGVEERALVSKGGLAYRIFIAVPKAPPPPEGYPVAYVLDGNAVVGTLADMARGGTLAQGGIMDPAVLVAIGYPGDAPINMPRRAKDLTMAPATPDKGSWTYLTPEGTGGADAFLAFIEDELKPAIAASFKVNPARQALMGHSFGGLFTLHVLFTRPDAFSTYVAASPSLWWANGAIAREEAAFARHPPKTRKRLVLTVGAYEQELHPLLHAGPNAEATARKQAERRMVDGARELAARLGALPGVPVDVTFTIFPGQTHASAAPHALLLGLETFLAPQSMDAAR
ncbi:prolyl oligopeptidase family serine peptidase [Xanthobacter autotrophicus]|uniref:alpha/beta hydrolase n=1 Tax=Xanthobacter TaxID=279 RepID=UPI0024AA0BC2|nr:alpha/beta hydrolase-fold protein [Xanthobacter autotrophicus]MDI4664130.1 prolyl oligopeptidase family serine peptidase [Xanthobacter autotrophicus]